MWKSLFLHDCIDILTNHGVLRSTDEVEVLALNLVHHSVHFSKAHNACNNVASNHKWWHAVGKASVYHKVTSVRNNCAVESCDISHKVIEAVACNLSCSVKVDTVKLFEDICVIWNFKIGNNRLAELFKLNVFGVVLTDWHAVIDDIRNNHHILSELFFKLRFLDFKSSKLVSILSNLLLSLLSFFLLTLSHQAADFLGNLVSVGTKLISLSLGSTKLSVESNNLINESEL